MKSIKTISKCKYNISFSCRKLWLLQEKNWIKLNFVMMFLLKKKRKENIIKKSLTKVNKNKILYVFMSK